MVILKEVDLRINTREEIKNGQGAKVVDADKLEFYRTRRRGNSRRCFMSEGILLDKDIKEVFKDCRWTLLKGYVILQRQVNNKLYSEYLHRIIMNCPKDKVIDHINGNKKDNRRKNLRVTSIRENANNQKRHREGKPVGIFYSKKDNLWVARIRDNGVRYSLGCYKTPEEAELAYQLEKLRIEQ